MGILNGWHKDDGTEGGNQKDTLVNGLTEIQIVRFIELQYIFRTIQKTSRGFPLFQVHIK